MIRSNVTEISFNEHDIMFHASLNFTNFWAKLREHGDLSLVYSKCFWRFLGVKYIILLILSQS